MTPGSEPVAYSAKFKECFAYKTIKDRLPVILTKIIDTLFRQRHDIKAQHGDDGSEQLKKVMALLSELRYRLTTNKPLLPFTGKKRDIAMWNQCLEEHKAQHSNEFTWFASPWLLAECYLYRRVMEAFEFSDILKNYDPFQFQKEEAFISAIAVMESTAKYLKQWKDDYTKRDACLGGEAVFNEFLQISLWGNRFDLSLSSGEVLHELKSPLDHVQELHPFILWDDSSKIYDMLLKYKTEIDGIADSAKRRLDIVLDNAGMELFGDLCLIEYLLTSKLVDTVILHVKSIPWFVSDTTHRDLTWTLEMLRCSHVPVLKEFGLLWSQRREDGQLHVIENDFWTSAYPYCEMKRIAPELYNDLTLSSLIVFKGDLNYRKLAGDLNWPVDTPFEKALRGFRPAPLVALRTLKADVIVGIGLKSAQEASEKHPDWQISGNYAVIQYLG